MTSGSTDRPGRDPIDLDEARYGVNAIPQDQLRDRIGELQHRIDQMMGDLDRDKERLAEQLDQAQQANGTASAAEDQVSATVSAYGEVLSLKVTDRAIRTLGAERLTETLLSVLREAREAAMAQASGAVDPKDLEVARDPVGHMLDAIPEVTSTLPPEMVARLRAPATQSRGREEKP